MIRDTATPESYWVRPSITRRAGLSCANPCASRDCSGESAPRSRGTKTTCGGIMASMFPSRHVFISWTSSRSISKNFSPPAPKIRKARVSRPAPGMTTCPIPEGMACSTVSSTYLVRPMNPPMRPGPPSRRAQGKAAGTGRNRAAPSFLAVPCKGIAEQALLVRAERPGHPHRRGNHCGGAGALPVHGFLSSFP